MFVRYCSVVMMELMLDRRPSEVKVCKHVLEAVMICWFFAASVHRLVLNKFGSYLQHITDM